eukprot:70515-Rhodomonas_salina.1
MLECASEERASNMGEEEACGGLVMRTRRLTVRVSPISPLAATCWYDSESRKSSLSTACEPHVLLSAS